MRFLLTAVVLWLCACNNNAGAEQAYCSATNACLGGRTCINGYCQDPDVVGGCVPLAPDAVISGNYPVLAIVDRTVSSPSDCSATAQPGADIDAVALYRGGQLIGVGQVQASGDQPWQFDPGADACSLNEHATPAAATGPRNAKGNAGFFSLNGGTLQVRFAGCSTAAKTVEQCDGLGPAVVPRSGDQIDVYEIDQWYVDTSRMPATCRCEAETYQLDLRTAFGAPTGQICLGQYQGTTSHIVVP